MSGRSSWLLSCSILALAGLVARPVAAQDAEGEESKGESTDVEDQAPAPKKKVKQAGDESAPVEPSEPNSALEEPGKSYYFVGARYRGIIIPKFMMNLFGDGGRAVYVHGFGPEFAVRKDGFEYNLSLTLARYFMDKTPFKASNDHADAWEIVQSKLWVLYFTTDFLWSHDFSPILALNYGVGAGIGVVFGDLHRNQAYPPYPGASPYKYNTCPYPGYSQPDFGGVDYCDTNPEHDHYGNYTEPTWAGGGNVPNIFPWLALQMGLRIKPHRHFMMHIDTGFGLSGFFFGLGGDYGI